MRRRAQKTDREWTAMVVAMLALGFWCAEWPSETAAMPLASPAAKDWLVFGFALPEPSSPRGSDEFALPSFERMVDLLKGQEVAVYGSNGEVIGSKPVVRELFHTWSSGAGILLLNWSKPILAAPPSTRFPLDGIRQAAATKSGPNWPAMSWQMTAFDPDELLHPGRTREWQTDESVHMPVAGPLFVFGQFGASTPSVDEQPLPRWQGKYGVGVKIKPWIVDEVQVRGGPTVRSDDTGRPLRSAGGERSELFLEAVTKLGLPVVGRLNLEYLNTATPSPTHHDRNLFNQEFRLARPLTSGGQVHMGARVRPDDSPVAESWVDRMQVFMGFELKR